ncbi:MAG: RHS repeat-associated core domain-containing protein [Fimbriimonadaceae bacterium]|nr:RHS repeat-associated core domain-containing protein [Fimbriimonadaceae bacterium]
MFNTAGNKVTRTYHEGQMAAEEEVLQGGALQTLTRSFLGGRGLEAMTTTESGNTSTAYPLYDTHGNMVATLTKNAAGTSWNVGNLRSYDVWGAVRSGAATGGPSGRYVANLGHVQDDESGLIYMRARYYEPGTGRFISEDPAGDGANWYSYASNQPNIKSDASGKTAHIVMAMVFGAIWGFVSGIAESLSVSNSREKFAIIVGAVVGGVLGAAVTAAGGGVFLGSAVSSATSIALADMLSGKGFNLIKVLTAAGIGGVMGAAMKVATHLGFKNWALKAAAEDIEMLDVALAFLGGIVGDGVTGFVYA